MRQAELARRAGISASYLNLIEHNRRRIGGKLLLDIAEVLGVEPALLSEGAEATLIGSLREAAADGGAAGAEVEAADEFAGRYPGWARLLSDQARRIGRLEQSVEALADRLAHDPHLAASLHEVLSTVTAIHSAASILVDTKELEPEWRERFHRNIREDSARLAEGAQRLVDELDTAERQDVVVGTPQEEVDAFLDKAGHSFPALEGGDAHAVEQVLEAAALSTSVARDLAQSQLQWMAADSRALPLERLTAALNAATPDEITDPVALAARLGVGVSLVMRRLVMLPDKLAEVHLPAKPGLVIADASGAILYRREVPGFPLPRFGTACPLWPLFSALSRPMFPIVTQVRMAGRGGGVFQACAMADAELPPNIGADLVLRSHMLLWPSEDGGKQAQGVGVTCRICPRDGCAARREPSIMGQSA
jgi:predicted transcriptional regulator